MEYCKLIEAARIGRVDKVKRGGSVTNEALVNTMIDTDKIVQCLYSAWLCNNLSTQIPSAYYIAIKYERKIVVPYFPPIGLCRCIWNALNIGVTEANIAGFTVKIFDTESWAVTH